jgi:hypothetical protein
VVLDPNPPSMFLNEALGNEEFAKRVTFIQGSPLLAKVRGTVLLGCGTLCFLVCITGGMLGGGWWVVAKVPGAVLLVWDRIAVDTLAAGCLLLAACWVDYVLQALQVLW